ncbi:MAG: amino acid adenylation domain-containing protein [Actinobacteria bacterium]|nr:amino acid adenylation domain-containing protein [Actinomycetota bacterium]
MRAPVAGERLRRSHAVPPSLLHDLARRAAWADPGAEAAMFRGEGLSYGELADRAGALAATLADAGVRRGDRVGIHLPRGIEMLVAVHGALAAGAAYVPIDPMAPSARAAAIADDCDLSALVTTPFAGAPLLRAARSARPRIVVVADDGDEVPDVSSPWVRFADAARGGTGPDLRLTDEDLALIVYTSGSTGVPKGVMISHRAVVAFARALAARSGVGPEDRLSGATPLHFSMSMVDLFHAAAEGASVVLVPEEDTFLGPTMARALAGGGVSIWTTVPSALRLVLQAGLPPDPLPGIRQVWFGGEVLPARDLSALRRLLPRAELWHMYGGTETLGRTAHLVEGVPEEGERIPLGLPFDGADAIVLREDGSEAGPGELGELHVRGAMLMKGYWRDPVRTASTLVPNPLAPELPDVLCRTGDLVRRRDDGALEFAGRLDQQVKSRGIRIELGDVEAALLGHPAVAEAVAVAVPDEVWGTVIGAFVVLARGEGVPGTALRSYLAGRLPLAMVPAGVEVLEALPHNSSGKVDRLALGERWVRGGASAPARMGGKR